MYASDFPTAATAAQALIKEEPTIEVAYLPLAMEALTSGDHARARVDLPAGRPIRGSRRLGQRDRARGCRDV